MKRFSIDIVWTDDTCLWIETKDGRRMCTPFSKWKRTKEPVPMIRYVGFNCTSSFFINDKEGIMEQVFSLLPSEQTAKAIQDIFNKPEEKGGRGWDYYREFLKERTGKDIDDRSANVWINRWITNTGMFSRYYWCYEIDLDNGYQDYELTEHWLPMKIPAGLGAWFMHVLVYKGDRLIEGWEIK